MKQLFIALTFTSSFFYSAMTLACPYQGNYQDDCPMYNNWKEERKSKSWRGWNKSMSMVRHHYVMRNGIPDKYSKMKVSLTPTPERLKQGKKLYQTNCMACHGTSGRGDGPAAKSLTPSPIDLVRFTKMHMATDGYLFWTISEGGTPIKTAMPAFKDSLKKAEMSKIILYIRQL